MSAAEPKPTRMRRRHIPAFLLAMTGLTAAFAVVSCCALPLILAGLGIGGSAALLGGVTLMAAPHRGVLLAFGVACLGAAAVLLWRQRGAAVKGAVGDVCFPSAILLQGALAGLAIGTVLLVLGYMYA